MFVTVVYCKKYVVLPCFSRFGRFSYIFTCTVSTCHGTDKNGNIGKSPWLLRVLCAKVFIFYTGIYNQLRIEPLDKTYTHTFAWWGILGRIWETNGRETYGFGERYGKT